MKAAGLGALPARRTFEVALEREGPALALVCRPYSMDGYHWSQEYPAPPRKPVLKKDGRAVYDRNTGMVVNQEDERDPAYRKDLEAFMRRSHAYKCRMAVEALRVGDGEPQPVEWSNGDVADEPAAYDAVHAELMAFGLSPAEVAMVATRVLRACQPQLVSPGDADNPFSLPETEEGSRPDQSDEDGAGST